MRPWGAEPAPDEQRQGGGGQDHGAADAQDEVVGAFRAGLGGERGDGRRHGREADRAERDEGGEDDARGLSGAGG
ncbi:hypothetical protein [Streptomyces sp. NPDC013187]|uniref:hypothetical protein n=1 Tax=Streptomyces sp. NPDC013187 TaxID=3364865 RepID=UPI0036B87454